MVSGGYGQSFDRPLKLTLSAEKNIYALGDEIEFSLDFMNTSPQDIYIYVSNLDRAKLFNMTDEKGNKPSYQTAAVYDVMWNQEDYKLIKAGGHYVWKIKAKVLNNKGPMLDFGGSTIRLTGAGKFQMSVVYQGWDGLTSDKNGKPIAISKKLGIKNVFVGMLTSNTVPIELKELIDRIVSL